LTINQIGTTRYSNGQPMVPFSLSIIAAEDDVVDLI
jgi:hypothetical protein